MAGKPASIASSTPSSSWKELLWDSADVSKEERRFLLKISNLQLDFTLLTFGTLGMLIKWIDTSNITNAFVSGRKEDLNLFQSQYNYIVVSWTIGYIIGQWPSNFILTRVPAHIWIPFLEIGWTVFTFSLAAAMSSLLAVWISDGPLRGRRWPTIIFGNLVAIVIFTLLVVTPVFGPFSHRAPLYILSSIGGTAVPLAMAWIAELISDNAEQRAFTAAATNTLQYTFSAWIPLVWFQQVHQPNVTPGNRAAAVVAGLNVIVFAVIVYLADREKLQKKQNAALTFESEASDSSPHVVGDGIEKKSPLVDEEDITPVIKS